ncbi:MAG: hypothetical protein V7604_1589 [Hyphomicrobiales bacterium]|jgi:hypothetical protein
MTWKGKWRNQYGSILEITADGLSALSLWFSSP